MTAIKMDGEALAARIKDDLRRRVTTLADQGVVAGLGTILVGDDGPSANYVSMKHRDCAELAMRSVDRRLPAEATQAEVEAAVEELNASEEVHAFIIQYPFPSGLDYESAILRLDPAKDADGLHPLNLGRLVMGETAPLACTPAGIVEMLRAYEVPISGRHVVIVGRGLTIGRPLANLLTLKRPEANAAVTVVHTGVADVGAYTRTADVIVAAAGSPGLITADMVRPGAAVVAAGVSFRDGKLLSDVADDVAEVAGWLSPRVGGVGPMTRAMLMSNTVKAAERAADGAKRATAGSGEASDSGGGHDQDR
jgi:methylenetetrahydrofolate dehydrogenase (NADP+)/methenyltetrahydrofolate cyclohydrolase